MIYYAAMGFDDASVPRRSSWLIYIYLLSALAIFLIAAFVIYYRFWMTPETDCSLVVRGTPAMTDATAVVERVTTNEDLALRLVDGFRAANQYDARFFLASGTYRVTVIGKGGRVLHAEPGEFIPPGRRLTLDLRRKFPATAPTSDGMTKP